MKKMIRVKQTTIHTNDNVVVVDFETDLGNEFSMKAVKVQDKWEVIEGKGAKNNLVDTYVNTVIDMMVSSVEKITSDRLFRDSDLGPRLLNRM